MEPREGGDTDECRSATPPFHVVIAGGGVAALEATLALRDLAADLVEVTLVSPTDRFTFVRIGRCALWEVGGQAVRSVSHRQRPGCAVGGRRGGGFGAGSQARDPCGRQPACLPRALDRLWRGRARGGTRCHYISRAGGCGFRGTLLGEVADGSVDRLLFAMLASLGWTLPLYELCLLTGRYLVEHDYVHHYANGNRRRTPPRSAWSRRKRPRSGVSKRGQRRRDRAAGRTGSHVPAGPDACALPRRSAGDAARWRPDGGSGGRRARLGGT